MTSKTQVDKCQIHSRTPLQYVVAKTYDCGTRSYVHKYDLGAIYNLDYNSIVFCFYYKIFEIFLYFSNVTTPTKYKRLGYCQLRESDGTVISAGAQV